MLLSDIIKRINKLVSNSSSFQLNYSQLKHYIDASVDYVNLNLKTDMLTPQEAWDKKNIHDYINSLLSQYSVYTISELMLAITTDSNNNYNITNESEFKVFIDENLDAYLVTQNLTAEVPTTYEYTEMPDNIIRTVLIYYIAASYLEEEDEFETQHTSYIERATRAMQEILKTYYCMYHTNMDSDLYKLPRHHHKDNSKPFNPYWIAGDE